MVNINLFKTCNTSKVHTYFELCRSGNKQKKKKNIYDELIDFNRVVNKNELKSIKKNKKKSISFIETLNKESRSREIRGIRGRRGDFDRSIHRFIEFLKFFELI